MFRYGGEPQTEKTMASVVATGSTNPPQDQSPRKWSSKILNNLQQQQPQWFCQKCSSQWHETRLCSGGRRCRECDAGECTRVKQATKVMKKRNKSKEAVEWFEKLKREGHKPNVECYTVVISHLVSHNKVKEAQLLLDQMKEDGLMPDAICYNALINGFCNLGSINEAMSLLEQMNKAGCQPTTSTYNTLIKGYGLAGQPGQALQLLQLLLHHGDGNKLPKPNMRSFNMLLNAWCEYGRIAEAWRVVGMMEAAGLQPDTVTYNTLAAAYAQAGRVVELEDLIQEMKNARVRPNVRTYDILIDCYCQQGMPDRAVDVLTRLKFEGLSPDTVAFNTLLRAYLKESDSDGKLDPIADVVDKVLKMMKANGVRPDVATFSTIMNSWSSAGFADRAEMTLVQMQEAGVKPDVMAFAILAKGYVRSGRTQEAELLLTEMGLHDVTPNVVVYTTIISGWCGIGRMDDALRVLETMVQRGESPNLNTFRTLIWGFCEVRQPRHAEDLLAVMVDFGLTPDTKCLDMISDAWWALGLNPQPPLVQEEEQENASRLRLLQRLEEQRDESSSLLLSHHLPKKTKLSLPQPIPVQCCYYSPLRKSLGMVSAKGKVGRQKELEDRENMIGRQSQGVLRVLKDHQRDAAPKQLQQVEILELRRVNKELQYQKRDLNVKLCAAESKVAALVSKNELIEEEALALKSGKEELRRQVESLQNNRFSEVEELVYLRWVNACLRCELCNSESNADHKATELNKDLSPRSQGKAKQLMLEYVVLACRRDCEERAYDSGDLLVDGFGESCSVTKKCYKLEGGRSGSVGVLSAEENNLNSIAECFQIMSQSVSTGKLADKYPTFKDRHKLVARVESRPSRSSKTVNGTPPPPPPPPLPAAKSKSPCNEVQRAPQVIELYNTMMKREHSTKPAAVGSCSLADVHSNMVGEIENRSAHLLAIKSDVQKHGRFVESLATDIRAAAFTKMDDVVSFVHWLDEKLSFLVDERAVIKNFNWPESKVDALRESAFTYQDLSKLGQQLTSFQDDARMKRDDAMKRMQAMLERVEHGIYGFLRSRDTAASCYKEYKIPTEWMIESGLVGKVKHSSVKLAEQFMRRVVSELDTAENELVREFLLLQGVRFAFRVHQFAGGFNEESMQAFEELRNRATSSTSIGHYC